MSIIRIIGAGGLVICSGLLLASTADARPHGVTQNYGERLRDLGLAEAAARQHLIHEASCQRKQLLDRFISMKRCHPHRIPELSREYVRGLQAVNRWFAAENLRLVHHFRQLREQAQHCHLHGGHPGHRPVGNPYGVAVRGPHVGVHW